MPTLQASLRATRVSEIEAQQGRRPSRALNVQPETHGTNKQINGLSHGLPESTGSSHPKKPEEVIIGSPTRGTGPALSFKSGDSPQTASQRLNELT